MGLKNDLFKYLDKMNFYQRSKRWSFIVGLGNKREEELGSKERKGKKKKKKERLSWVSDP